MKIAICLWLIVAALSFGGSSAIFANTLDKPFTYTCKLGETITEIYSEHDNKKEDRRWKFGCSPVGAKQDCYWTKYVNSYDGLMLFQCRNQGMITGVSSLHHNKHEDRKFKFRCCSIPNGVLTRCYYTNWVNDYDKVMNFKVPDKRVLRGAFSIHYSKKEDRKWKFHLCEIPYVIKS